MKSILSISMLLGYLVAVASVMTAAADSSRKPPYPPNPPQTFDRLRTRLGKNDNCYDWETREFEKEFPPSQFGLTDNIYVVCRSKCPPGYGTAKDQCVWQQSFAPHARVLGPLPRNDDCYNDQQPVRITNIPDFPASGLLVQVREALPDDVSIGHFKALYLREREACGCA